MRELTESGQRSRCVHRRRGWRRSGLQGRLEEAEELLAGLEHDPDAVRAVVAVRLGRGETSSADALLVARLDQIGWRNLLAAPLLEQLVLVRLADERVDEARAAAEALGEIAASRDGSASRRQRARPGAGGPR